MHSPARLHTRGCHVAQPVCCQLLTADPATLVCAALQAGLTALHYAAWQGSVDAVQLLLEKGINVNAADPVSGQMQRPA